MNEKKYSLLGKGFASAMIVFALAIQAFPKVPAVVNVDILIVGGTIAGAVAAFIGLSFAGAGIVMRPGCARSPHRRRSR